MVDEIRLKNSLMPGSMLANKLKKQLTRATTHSTNNRKQH